MTCGPSGYWTLCMCAVSTAPYQGTKFIPVPVSVRLIPCAFHTALHLSTFRRLFFLHPAQRAYSSNPWVSNSQNFQNFVKGCFEHRECCSAVTLSPDNVVKLDGGLDLKINEIFGESWKSRQNNVTDSCVCKHLLGNNKPIGII